MNFRRVCSILLLVTLIIGCRAQEPRNVRPPAVAGQFYPEQKSVLHSEVARMLRDASAVGIRSNNIAAMILPHAGYVFSGPVAARGVAALDPDAHFDNIFLIGVSHRVAFRGASVYTQGDFSTPLGIVPVNTELGNALVRADPVFNTRADAHDREHCLEVQLPFLQARLRSAFRIVPIVLGTESPEICGKVASVLRPYFTARNLFVISSDFSHYPEASAARRADSLTAAAIATGSPDRFLETLKGNAEARIPELATSACGAAAILTLLYMAQDDPSISISRDLYRNSGDTPAGKKDAVVGYWAISFGRGDGAQDMSLREQDKSRLLRHARMTLERRLSGRPDEEVDTASLPEALRRHCGAFVTLRTRGGELRGCIGQFIAKEPLYIVVHDMAIAAATQDTRFNEVTRRELDDLHIEISVLTPLRRIASIDEFVLGKHGIYMKKNGRSGTFLPQVEEETHWTRDEFLGHCARDKAGIGWDGWKDAELYTYEAIVFGER
jgi:MEMO1 family protein